MNPGALAFSVLAGVAQPIFEAATLLHRRRAAIAAYDQALAAYRYTVLVAFQNVADSLRALQSDADYVKAQAAAERSASESYRVAREQYQAGYIAYPSLLAAEYAYQQTLLALVQAEASRYTDTAALFKPWRRLVEPIGCHRVRHLAPGPAGVASMMWLVRLAYAAHFRCR